MRLMLRYITYNYAMWVEALLKETHGLAVLRFHLVVKYDLSFVNNCGV